MTSAYQSCLVGDLVSTPSSVLPDESTGQVPLFEKSVIGIVIKGGLNAAYVQYVGRPKPKWISKEYLEVLSS